MSHLTQEQLQLLDDYMVACVADGAHDALHVRRVLYLALELAETEENVDREVLIAACLLHDVGQAEEMHDPAVRHAAAGAVKAERFLIENGFGEAFANKVARSIAAHSFGTAVERDSIESKLLFDADKLDAIGASGTLRMVLSHGEWKQPLYRVMEDGTVSDGRDDPEPNYFMEYHDMIARVPSAMLTDSGKKAAQKRAETARLFYDLSLDEVRQCHQNGQRLLKGFIKSN